MGWKRKSRMKMPIMRKYDGKGSLPYLRIPGKWKDKERIRSLVSFADYVTKELGKLVARCLTEIIRRAREGVGS